tara:strand:+ start:743 stop:1897 length:1155 start_codon:yes stop_codon:yes gene_type:complete
MKQKYEVLLDIREDYMSSENGKYKINGNGITLQKKGSWLGTANSYSLTNEIKEDLGIKYKPSKTLSMQDKKLYRYPKLDLPRQKVDLLKDKYNVKVIRDPEKADFHIISNKLIDNMISFGYSYSLTFKEFFTLMKDGKDKDFLTPCGVDKLRAIIETIGPDSMIETKVHKSWGLVNKPTSLKNCLNFFSDSIDSYKIDKKRDMTVTDANEVHFDNIINSKYKIVYDTDIINIIDGELAVLENEEYKAVSKMIEGGGDNKSLALEMLANCNVEKSFDLVSNIYYWYFDRLRYANNWNSVNVKALRNRMIKYNGDKHIGSIYPYSNFINLLVEDNKLTKFSLDLTRKKLYDTVLSSLVGDRSSVFNVSFEHLELKEPLKENVINHD